MDTYTIAEDSPIKRASVDDIELKAGDAPVKLTKDQVGRVEETGVNLTKTKSNEGDNQS